MDDERRIVQLEQRKAQLGAELNAALDVVEVVQQVVGTKRKNLPEWAMPLVAVLARWEARQTRHDRSKT